jgi:hypothetical protein
MKYLCGFIVNAVAVRDVFRYSESRVKPGL